MAAVLPDHYRAADPEIALYQERYGAIIQPPQVMHWLDAAVPDADLLVTPPARLFRVEEINLAPRQETCRALIL